MPENNKKRFPFRGVIDTTIPYDSGEVPPWVTRHTDIEGADNYFLRDPVGGQWYVRMGANTCRVPDRVGLGYLDVLLRNPGSSLRSVELRELVGGVGGQSEPKVGAGENLVLQTFQRPTDLVDSHEADEILPEKGGLDAASKKPGYGFGFGLEEQISHEVKCKLLDRRAALAGQALAAQAAGNTSEASSLRREAGEIQKYLDANTFMGRPKLEKTAERCAYDTVSAGMKAALADISSESKAIGDHFRRAVEHEGTRWTYRGPLEWRLVPAYLTSPDLEVRFYAVDHIDSSGKFERLPSGDWRIEREGSRCLTPHVAGMACIASLLHLRGYRVPAASLRNAGQSRVETSTEREKRVLREHVANSPKIMEILYPSRYDPYESDNEHSMWKMDDEELAELAESIRDGNLVEAVRAKRIGNTAGFNRLISEIATFEKACAAIIKVRERWKALRAEDDKARSGVSHNIDTALCAISEQNPELGDHLRGSIESGREFVYLGATQWDVSY